MLITWMLSWKICRWLRMILLTIPPTEIVMKMRPGQGKVQLLEALNRVRQRRTLQMLSLADMNLIARHHHLHIGPTGSAVQNLNGES
jgi:hypothetical protein